MNACERNTNEEEGLRVPRTRLSREKRGRGREEEGDAAVSGIFYLVVGANVPAEASRSSDIVTELHTMRTPTANYEEREKCASDSFSSRHRLEIIRKTKRLGRVGQFSLQ